MPIICNIFKCQKNALHLTFSHFLLVDAINKIMLSVQSLSLSELITSTSALSIFISTDDEQASTCGAFIPHIYPDTPSLLVCSNMCVYNQLLFPEIKRKSHHQLKSIASHTLNTNHIRIAPTKTRPNRTSTPQRTPFQPGLIIATPNPSLQPSERHKSNRATKPPTKKKRRRKYSTHCTQRIYLR